MHAKFECISCINESMYGCMQPDEEQTSSCISKCLLWLCFLNNLALHFWHVGFFACVIGSWERETESIGR